ncbi:hypothetical protein NQ318_015807 [Aromia moschata]|uniref:CLIP domain-containing serine protease n=1 Tax=Aromia moschata TaxID=1265417 RepID=A0AAV8YPF7_9CUCU|nr:hypothetical protein NQ318_015807 [Aromia moschata]
MSVVKCSLVLTRWHPCYTPRDQYGLCINIKKCAVLIQMLKTQSGDPAVREYLRSSTCGYEGSTPMVCCPQSTVKSDPDVKEGREIDDSSDENTTTEGPKEPAEQPLPNVPDCGFSNVTNARVVGGQPAAANFRGLWHSATRTPNNPNSPKWLCGGTMITDRHILTAGHCVYNRPDLYIARVGEYDLYDDKDGATPEDITMAKAKIHEDFSSVTFTNDIAILTLTKSTNKNVVWPICLPHAEPYRSNKFLKYRPLIAGWGATYFHGPSSSNLQVASVPVVDNSNCQKAFKNRSVIDDRILCAGWTLGGKDACLRRLRRSSDVRGQRRSKSEILPDRRRVLWIQVCRSWLSGCVHQVTNFIDWIRRNLN